MGLFALSLQCPFLAEEPSTSLRKIKKKYKEYCPVECDAVQSGKIY
jgi:hypothetical protein